MKKLDPKLVILVKILKNLQFHDGTSLGQALKISRAGIWKMMQKLIAYGLPIHAVKGKGYQLCRFFGLLDVDEIKKLINFSNTHITIFETINSTNLYLKQAPKIRDKIQICLAETQTAGKGRFNRSWYSPFGKNIYISLRYSFNKDLSELGGLSLLIGLVICRAILKTVPNANNIGVKWPNDVLFDYKKLAGSLIEIQAETHGRCYAIIGIGLNTNLISSDHPPIPQAWTSLQLMTGKVIDRNLLVGALINELINALDQFAISGLTPHLSEWYEKDILNNQLVRLKTHETYVEGRVLGLTSAGHLRLELADGRQASFSSGDTTLIK